jgi:hypothetical protein
MVERTEAAVVCEHCKQKIRWGPWELFNVVLREFPFSSVAEKREGTCGCKGKHYIQSRPPLTAIGTVKKQSRRS